MITAGGREGRGLGGQAGPDGDVGRDVDHPVNLGEQLAGEQHDGSLGQRDRLAAQVAEQNAAMSEMNMKIAALQALIDATRPVKIDPEKPAPKAAKAG